MEERCFAFAEEQFQCIDAHHRHVRRELVCARLQCNVKLGHHFDGAAAVRGALLRDGTVAFLIGQHTCANPWLDATTLTTMTNVRESGVFSHSKQFS